MFLGVGLVAQVVCFQGIVLSLVGLVSWCWRSMRPTMRPVRTEQFVIFSATFKFWLLRIARAFASCLRHQRVLAPRLAGSEDQQPVDGLAGVQVRDPGPPKISMRILVARSLIGSSS